ncbi:MAG TPA: phosphate signaling complex protein PhoU [Candidatus Wallbacteria bacterium]|nr:phosphate signaling complex protein PhoU [Candidatus Wallbacteria bacterium]
MGKLFEKEVENLKELLKEMSDIAISMISDVIEALVTRDASRMKSLNEKETSVNRLEMEIDDLAWKMIALRQPMGTDLRFIIASIKVNSSLERIGDEAINIGQKTEYLIGVPQLKPLIDIPRMSEIAIHALSASIQTLYDGDTDTAREVCINDNEVDDLRNQIYRELITYMQDSSENIQRSLNLIFIARSLERIGDMATDIAEDAIYLHQGKDIRHHAESDEEFKKNYRGKKPKK